MNGKRLAVTLALGIAMGIGVTAARAKPVSNEFGPNLVANGGFENTSSIAGSGWTASGGLVEGIDFLVDTDPGNAHGGAHSFAGGAIGGLGFISQNIATTAGASYNIHLWLANPSGFSDNTTIQILWGGNVVYSATDILGFGYTEIVVDPIATSSSTTLSIGFQDDNFYLNVDDVSVRAVPEPESLVLMAIGLGAIGLARRRAAPLRARPRALPTS